MACLTCHGRYCPSVNLLVPLSHGGQLRVSKKLDEEAEDSILAGNKKVLATASRGLWLVVHVSALYPMHEEQR